MRQKRTLGLACLLLATVLAIGLAGPAAARPIEEEEPLYPNIEESGVLDPEAPQVQIISLADLEPMETGAAALLQSGGEDLTPADPAEMGTTLAELTLKDGTIIRLYATAEGRFDGAFLRPGGAWTRFIRLYDGSTGRSCAVGATLTAFSGVLEHDGFLLRTNGHSTEFFDYHYFWFDGSGELQMLSAYMDPVSLDMDGDGRDELVYNFNDWWGPLSFYYQREDGSVCRVMPAAYLDQLDIHLAAVDAQGEGPVRLICRCWEGTEERLCAVTFQEEALWLEWDIDGALEETPEDAVTMPELPNPAYAPWSHVAIAAPDGWVMDGAGHEVSTGIWLMLRWFGETVLVPSDQPLDGKRAYTVTVTPGEGDPIVWSMDPGGVCRISGMEGDYRILRTGSGSPAAYCCDLLKIYCDASRTSRDYDEAGRWLGRSLAAELAAK